ncbi:MAG: hypothetical protein HKN82_10790, partial [Akkermansiaceae bacterium]|nr:hypothetical protein [Akkermansiaceae bacterium]
VVHDFRSLGMTSERMSEYAILLHAWGQADPQGALDYALKNTGTNFARKTVLASWAGDDPEAALTWANAHAPEGKPNALLIGVIEGIAPRDLTRATEILGTLPRSEERGEALRAMLPLVLSDGLDPALAWSETIPDSVLRQGAVTFIAQSIADEDPQQAADIVLSLPEREFQERGLYGISASWADADPDGAMAWAENLDPELRDEAAAGIVADLARNDSLRAAEWIESLAGSTDIQPAVRTLVDAVSRKDPALALAWTTELETLREQERSYHSVLGDWMRRDAATARSWLESNRDQVPESVRRRFSPDRSDRPPPPGG